MRRLVWALVLNAAADGFLRVVHHKRRHHQHHELPQHHELQQQRRDVDEAELQKLNAVVGEYGNALDLKSRECAALRADAVRDQLGHNELVPVASSSALLRARRDLSAEQSSLAQLAERAAGERPALKEHRRQCRQEAKDGAKRLKALQKEIERMETLPAGSTGEVRDRMATALGTLSDRAADLEDTIHATAEACRDVKEEMEEQMLHVRLAQEGLDVALAHSTAALNAAVEKKQDAADLHRTAVDREVAAHACMGELAKISEDLCGAKKTRAALVANSGAARTLLDCEVSEWIPGPCSASCGGGHRQLGRKIVVEANGGAACPPLGREEKCNDFPCSPVDCEMSDWSPWSACEHVQSRSRSERRAPSERGAPCGATSETRVCVEEEEPHCSLGEWAEWSGCSRACGGGVSIRTRAVAEACGAAETEMQRLCNQHECGAAPQCASAAAQNLVFVLDGSGSLGSAGFTALKDLLVDVAKRVPRAAVILAGSEVHPVSMLAAGTEAAEKAAAVTFPDSLTTVPAALGRVTALGADTVVVLTDGEPNSARALREASEAVRRKARLLFVTEEKHDVSEYASSPTHDNVLVLSPFAYRESAADLLVTMLCAQLA